MLSPALVVCELGKKVSSFNYHAFCIHDYTGCVIVANLVGETHNFICLIHFNFWQLLDGIKIYELNRNVDERGFFGEIFRTDWKDLLQGDEIVQANLSSSYPGMIRAWHRHNQGQVDYFIVIQGVVKICGYDEISGEINEIISSEDKLQIVRIPGHYWHGLKNVGYKKATVMYLVNKLYNYENPDEERRPWDDTSIVDKKSGLTFDWNRAPHK